MKKSLTIILILFTLPNSSQTSFDSVTITASLTKTKISESGRDMIMLKGEQLRQLPLHSFDELLPFVPGRWLMARVNIVL